MYGPRDTCYLLTLLGNLKTLQAQIMREKKTTPVFSCCGTVRTSLPRGGSQHPSPPTGPSWTWVWGPAWPVILATSEASSSASFLHCPLSGTIAGQLQSVQCDFGDAVNTEQPIAVVFKTIAAAAVQPGWMVSGSPA